VTTSAAQLATYAMTHEPHNPLNNSLMRYMYNKLKLRTYCSTTFSLQAFDLITLVTKMSLGTSIHRHH